MLRVKLPSPKTLALAALLIVVGAFLGGMLSSMFYAPVAPLAGEAGYSAAPRLATLPEFKAPAKLAAPQATPSPPAVKSEAPPSGEWFATAPGRMVIHEGRVRLRVPRERVRSTAREVTRIAVDLGGYVAASEVYEDRATVVIRVPLDKFEEAMSEVSKLGEVVSTSTNAIDVTEEYVDLQARLNALKRVEERLFSLLNMAKTVDDMLKVEEQLRRIRVEIERIEARIKYLERRVEYSTITVHIEAPPKVIPPMVTFPSFNPLPAVANGLGAMYAIIYAAITATIALAPLIAIGVPAYLAYRKFYRRSGGK